MTPRSTFVAAFAVMVVALLPTMAHAQGSISGTVTNSTTTAAVQGVTVQIYRAVSGGGQFVTTAQTNGAGAYTTVVLPSGTYFAYTQNELGFIDEIYDNMPCVSYCSGDNAVASGTPIVVGASGVSGRNFALVPGVTITGTITNAATSAPIVSTTVQIHTVVSGAPTYVTTAVSDATGVYTVRGLAAGTYYAFTRVDGFVDEIYNDVACQVQCSDEAAVARGTPIVAATGATMSGIDFALTPSARITGKVTSAATTAVLPNVQIQVFDLTGAVPTYVRTAVTDSAGVYSVTELIAGTYYAFTRNELGYIDEIFDNIPCAANCTGDTAVLIGTAIVVTAGSTATGRDFALAQGGTVAGKILDDATGAPLQGIRVIVTGPSSTVEATTDAAGNYVAAGLPNGTYRAYTANTLGFINEVFDNIRCPGSCTSSLALAQGTPIPVTVGATAGNRDFRLNRGGTISGTVTSAATGAPLANVTVNVFLNQGGTVEYAGEAQTNAAGAYAVIGLPNGSFYAATDNVSGYINELYGNIPCLGECDPSASTLGPAIAVVTGATTSGRDFALDQGGRIGGTVTHATTGAPIEFVAVDVFSGSGRYLTSGFSDATGAYVTGAGLPNGTYFISTRAASSQNFVNEVFDNIPCSGYCSHVETVAGTGVAVTVGTTATGKNFALAVGGRISGRVTDAATAAALQGVQVNILSRFGGTYSFATTVYTDSAGLYTTDAGLPAGQYFAFTATTLGYQNKIFNNISCGGECSPFIATRNGGRITVTAGTATTGQDFALQFVPRSGLSGPPGNFVAANEGGAVRFSWTAPTSGGPPASYLIEAGFASGATAVTIPVTGTTYLVPGVPPGRYFMRVRGVNAAGNGVPSEEYVLTVGAGGTVAPEAPFNLKATTVSGRLVLSWDMPSAGGTPTDFLVEAGTTSGAANIATIPVASRAFTYDPVPSGAYFMRVRARNAAGVSRASNELLINVGNVPAPPAAAVNFDVIVEGDTVTFGWAQGSPGTTSYIIEAGSAPGLSNIAVLNTGNTDTSISFTNVPRGTYFVRLRAVNASGASVASNEVRLIVP